ncbi:MAG TPA: CBS domain-containing protein [Nannocystaceae bacterium]|nr:CBS domain-containing protein [Nannocystaceae bacterium]
MQTTTTDPRVGDVMTREVLAVAPDTGLETAARLFAHRGISGAPVVEGRRVVGVVSLADLADPDRDHTEEPGYPLFYRISDGFAHEVGEHVLPQEGRVADVMTRSVVSISADATIFEAAERMLQLGVHRLLVVRGEELIGIITTVGLLRAFVQVCR